MSTIGLIAARGAGTAASHLVVSGSPGSLARSGSIAKGGGKFAAAVNGIIGAMVSSDADAWRKIPTLDFPAAIGSKLTYLNGRFVTWSEGGGPAIAYSVDGEYPWTGVVPTGGPAYLFADMIHDGVQYVGVQSSAFGYTDGVWTSPDLATWTLKSSTGMNTIAYLAGVYIGVRINGRAYRSTDLVTWTEILFPTISGNGRSVSVANGRFIISGGSPACVHSGTDGYAWTSVSGGFASFQFDQVTWNGAVYIFGPTVSNPDVLISPDLTGTSVTSFSFFTDKGTTQVFDGDRFSTVTDGARIIHALSGGDFAYSSDNGASYTYSYGSRNYGYVAGTNTGTPLASLPGVAEGSSKEVLPIYGYSESGSIGVGLRGSILDLNGGAFKRTSGVTDDLLSVAYDGATNYVAVGANGKVLTSTDRVTWTLAATLGAFTMRSVIWNGAGLFVAVGDGGHIYTSPTGAVWTSRASGTANNLRCVRKTTHSTMTYVAVGDDRTFCYSANATAWTASTISIGGGFPVNLSCIEYGAGKFVASCDGFGIILSAAESVDIWAVSSAGTINDIRFQAPATFHLYGQGNSHLTAT